MTFSLNLCIIQAVYSNKERKYTLLVDYPAFLVPTLLQCTCEMSSAFLLLCSCLSKFPPANRMAGVVMTNEIVPPSFWLLLQFELKIQGGKEQVECLFCFHGCWQYNVKYSGSLILPKVSFFSSDTPTGSHCNNKAMEGRSAWTRFE